MTAKQLLPTLLAVAVALAAGFWLRGLMGHASSPSNGAASVAGADSPCPGGVAPLYWKAPMDPTYIRDKPGKSPMGMELVPECPSGAAVLAGMVQIDAGTVQNIGVRTALVERRDLSRAIRALGRVTYDERRVAHVHTKVQGWVEELHIDFVGQQVEAGAALLEIYSPELVATQEELLVAARYRDVTGESSFEDVRGGGQNLFDATRRRLALWDVPERDIDRLLRTGQIQKTLTLYAPSSGVVTELGVREGMEVEPNTNLYTIADLSTVWVVADVYESELPWVALGQHGEVELAYLPGADYSGPVTYIAPFLDPKTRTAEVRLELANPDGQLRPEMFGNTLIHGTPRHQTIAIPAEAILRSGKRNLAVVALGGGRFEPREVRLGVDSGDGWIEVSDGLEAGEQIVVSSQFLIDSESKLQEAVRKLLSAGAKSDAPVDDQHDMGHGAHGEHEE